MTRKRFISQSKCSPQELRWGSSRSRAPSLPSVRYLAFGSQIRQWPSLTGDGQASASRPQEARRARRERAQKLGVDPKELRDQVLRGEQHSELEDENLAIGSIPALEKYA